MPLSIPDSNAGTILFEFPSTLPIQAFSQYVGIIPDTGDEGYGAEYISLHSRVKKYQNMSVTTWSNSYQTILGAIEINSPTFDENANPAVRMSNTAETMDANTWFRDSGLEIYMDSGYVDSGYVTLT